MNLGWLLPLFLLVGCATSSSASVDTSADTAVPAKELEPSANGRNSRAVTRTYYIYNPTSAGCSSALRLTARGSGITSIVPTGCYGPPTWDSLTSAGASTLTDTWYARGTRFSKDYTSASTAAWCDEGNLVTVRVTGASVTSLSYWFTDSSACIF